MLDEFTSEFMTFRAGSEVGAIVVTLPGNTCQYLLDDGKCSIHGTGRRHQYCRDWFCNGKGAPPGVEIG